VLGVRGDDGGWEHSWRGVGSTEDEVGLAAVAKGFENVGVGEQIALLIDEESVPEESVVISARRRGLVEAVDDGADGSVGGSIWYRMIRRRKAESANQACQQEDPDCGPGSAMAGFGQVSRSGSKDNLRPRSGAGKLAPSTGGFFQKQRIAGAGAHKKRLDTRVAAVYSV